MSPDWLGPGASLDTPVPRLVPGPPTHLLFLIPESICDCRMGALPPGSYPNGSRRSPASPKWIRGFFLRLAERIPSGYVVKDAVFGGRGRGNQWLGGRSLPVHPIGMVSLRQLETRTVPDGV